MKTVPLLLLTSVAVIFLGFMLTPANAYGTNDVSIENISVQPYTVKVGDTFTVAATLVNNSTVPIVVDGGKCSVQDKQAGIFTIMLDSHTKIKAENINCAGVGWSQILDPGKNITGTSPDYTTNYVAAESGTANITVKFSYHAIIQRDPIQTGDEQTISKSFQFQINDVNETSTQKSTDFSNHNLQIYKIKEKNYEFFLPYTITNSKIQNMTVDCPSMSMIIHLASTSANGTLTIGLPRSLLDIKTQTGGDDNFSILVNGMEVNYLEIDKNQDARTLSIPFSADAMEIEIIGIAIGQNIPVVPHFCGIGGTNESSYYRLLSPLQQFQSGIDAKDVKCKQGLQFIMKNENGQPACVTSHTFDELITRGWGIIPLGGLPTYHNTSIFDTRIYPFFINVTNTDFTINYNISQGQIKSATIDMPSKSLILSVTTIGNGTLVIDLPRALIDPKIEGKDSAFIVLDDGREVLSKQIATTGTDRVLSIPFQYGVSQIQIISPVPIQ